MKSKLRASKGNLNFNLPFLTSLKTKVTVLKYSNKIHSEDSLYNNTKLFWFWTTFKHSQDWEEGQIIIF